MVSNLFKKTKEKGRGGKRRRRRRRRRKKRKRETKRPASPRIGSILPPPPLLPGQTQTHSPTSPNKFEEEMEAKSQPRAIHLPAPTVLACFSVSSAESPPSEIPSNLARSIVVPIPMLPTQSDGRKEEGRGKREGGRCAGQRFLLHSTLHDSAIDSGNPTIYRDSFDWHRVGLQICHSGILGRILDASWTHLQGIRRCLTSQRVHISTLI